MQAKTSTQQNFFSTQSIFSNINILSFLMICFLFMGQHVTAQMVLEVHDVTFSPGSIGESTQSSPFITDSSNDQSELNTSSNPGNFGSSSQSQNSSLIGNLSNISFSPNPIQNYARILKNPGIVLRRIDILDINGGLRFSVNIQSSFINVPYLEAGIYNFRVFTNVGVSSQLVSINPN